MPDFVHCLPNCGACCIAPFISSSIPGMPNGKAAGERCVQLSNTNQCALFGKPERPQVCIDFKPSEDVCTNGQAHAIRMLTLLEWATAPIREVVEDS